MTYDFRDIITKPRQAKLKKGIDFSPQLGAGVEITAATVTVLRRTADGMYDDVTADFGDPTEAIESSTIVTFWLHAAADDAVQPPTLYTIRVEATTDDAQIKVAFIGLMVPHGHDDAAKNVDGSPADPS